MDVLNTDSHQQPLRETLVPLLRQIVWERKHLAERMFRQAQQRAEEGGVPTSYEYPDIVSSLAQKREGVWELVRRDLTFCFTLWTRRTWIMNHRDRYSKSMTRDAKHGYNSFSPERDWYFVQFHGAADDLLWFGELVEAQLFRHLEHSPRDDQAAAERLRLARQLGYTYGCSVSTSGVLNPRSAWLNEHARRGDLLLEPEALYRGVLYGAALTLLALTKKRSAGELLQLSVDRAEEEERYQFLLPDGKKGGWRPLQCAEESEQMLQEIALGLVRVHGEVPIVSLPFQVSRFQLPQAGRYLFQWNGHLLKRSDVQTLVRFLLHGLALPGTQEAPVSLDMLGSEGGAPEEARTTKERSRVLQDAFGFTHEVVEGLSTVASGIYCGDFFAYYRFAGSREAALQASTLRRWMDHLQQMNYTTGTINRMVDAVQSILHCAATKGYVDQEVDASVKGIKPLRAATEMTSRQE
jgi:hypothetical protein